MRNEDSKIVVISWITEVVAFNLSVIGRRMFASRLIDAGSGLNIFLSGGN